MLLLFTEHNDYMKYFVKKKIQDLSWERFIVQLIESEDTDVGYKKTSEARLFKISAFWGERESRG